MQTKKSRKQQWTKKEGDAQSGNNKHKKNHTHKRILACNEVFILQKFEYLYIPITIKVTQEENGPFLNLQWVKSIKFDTFIKHSVKFE